MSRGAGVWRGLIPILAFVGIIVASRQGTAEFAIPAVVLIFILIVVVRARGRARAKRAGKEPDSAAGPELIKERRKPERDAGSGGEALRKAADAARDKVIQGGRRG